jgi:hypothetical protein
MEAVSPDIAKKLLSRDFANLVGRVQKGGKLTRAERAMLHTLATGTGAAPTTAPSYVELAAILGITRRFLRSYRKVFSHCPSLGRMPNHFSATSGVVSSR